MRKTAVLIIFVLLASALPISATADWPMFRNDATHSGVSNLTGNFSGVKCLWKYNPNSWIISSPSVADIDNDSKPEIVFGSGDGKIHVLDHNGAERWNKSVGYAGYDITSSPTLYDMDNDGKLEIVVSTFDKVYMFNSTGYEVYNFSITNWTEPCLSTTNPPMMISLPSIADINNDTKPEVVFGSINGRIYVLNSTFSEIWNKTFYAYVEGSCGAPIRGGGTYRDGVSSTPALLDLDGDGKMEIIFQTRSGVMHVFHWNGTSFWNYTVNSIVLIKSYSSTAWSSPVVDENMILIGSDDSYLYAFTSNGTPLWNSNVSRSPIKSTPGILGDKIIFGSTDGNVYCINKSGGLIWAYQTDDGIGSSPTIADIDNDTNLDIVIGSSDGRLYCLDENGTKLFSYQTNGSVSSSPAIADINGDGNAEIIFGSNDGYLYALTNATPETDLKTENISYSGDLIQGDKIKLSAEIKNLGTVDSNNVKVEFFDNNISIGNETVDFVSVNGEENADIEWIPSEEGVHKIKAEICGLTNETDVTNNNVSLYVTVQKRVIDLYPLSENIIYLEKTPNEGEIIVIHAVVYNDGNADAFNVNASVYVDDTLIDIIYFNSIPKNKSRDLSTYWTTTHGKHTIKIVVENNPYETKTENNIASTTINVQKTGEEKPYMYLDYWIALAIILGIVIYILIRKRVVKQ